MGLQLNSNEIAEILPHRYPFALVDRITDGESGVWAKGIKCVSVGEPFFCGHFPQKHVMPGVLILEALAQVGAVAILSLPENRGKIALFGGVKNARFKRQVIPGDVLELECTLTKRRGPVGIGACTATVNGETVYPYEAGKLEYYRAGDLTSTVSGTVISSNLVDYLSVTPGQVLVRIDGEDSETEIFTAQQNLEEAQKKLEAAQKNLDNCNAVAPISGQVIGLSVTPGQELQANSTLVTISDTSTVIISATVDERNISYIKTGMSVNLDQWGTSAFGTVETVSLSSTVNNGVASYPITISADNTDGNLQVNSYVNYQIQASQNDNCLMVPIQAVRTVGLEDGSSATVVYVQADSRPDNALELPYQDEEIPSGFYPVQVEIGIQDTYNVEIKSGVNDGDTVFTQMITDQAWG